MNSQIYIFSASNLLCNPNTNLFCKIYQPSFADFEIGKTSIQQGKSQFEWNECFQCHLIRGINFIFYIIQMKNEEQQILGKAKLNIFNLTFSQDIDLPIETNQNEGPKHKDKNIHPTLKIKIEQITDSKPIFLKNPSNRIPFNNVIYANLSFSPNYSPDFPYKSSLFDFACIPLDISFVAFDQYGNITHVVSNSDVDRSKKACHSKSTLCYCYDTFGPTIRLDLFETFFNKNGKTKTYSPFSNEYISHNSNTKLYSSFPSVRGVFVISVFDQSIPIEMYKWISIDFYISQEKHMRKTLDDVLICEPKLADVYFHSRMPVNLPRTGKVGSFTISSVAVFTADYENRNIEISPLLFSCPNYSIKIPTFSITEILPEIAQVSQVAQFTNGINKYERRVSCPLGCSASLGRALYINKFPNIMPKIRFCFSWKYLNNSLPKKRSLIDPQFEDYEENEFELELETSLFAIDDSFQVLKICSTNNKSICNGAFVHSGKRKSSLAEITADFKMIPSNVSYLCLAINSFKPLDDPIKRINFVIKVGETVLFMTTKKNITKQGFIFILMKKEINDWTIIPLLKQVKENTPTLTQKSVTNICHTLFHS